MSWSAIASCILRDGTEARKQPVPGSVLVPELTTPDGMPAAIACFITEMEFSSASTMGLVPSRP